MQHSPAHLSRSCISCCACIYHYYHLYISHVISNHIASWCSEHIKMLIYISHCTIVIDWCFTKRYKQEPCDNGDNWCPYPWYPVPLPPEGQQSDPINQRTQTSPNPPSNIGKKNLIRPKPGRL